MKWINSPRSLLRLSVIVLGVLALAALILFLFQISVSPYLELVGVILAVVAVTLSVKKVFYPIFDRKNKGLQKEHCRFLDKDRCPYPAIDECPYNTDFCSAYQKSFSSKKKNGIWLVLFVVSCLSLILDYFFPDVFSFPSPSFWKDVVIAFVTASTTAYLVDMPNRMKEHQRYYIDLLTSNDYLKSLPESSLLQLREQITWVQRMKDVPNMPEGLIKLDKKVSTFLSAPYFRKYTQIVELSQKKGDTINKEPLITKKVHIEGTGFNPYPKDKFIRMDLGLSAAMCIDENAMGNPEMIKEQAASMYQLISFNVYFDGEKKPVNLLDFVDIQVETKAKDGFNYNAYLSLVNRRGKDESISQESTPSNPRKKPDYVIAPASSSPVELFVSFSDKVSFSIDYEIKVPFSDTCFTKRLRYPVKYLHIDYTLGKGLENLQLVGQVIGTMIDQSDISIYSPEDKSRILMDTRSWLLPKNGAIIVHQMKNIDSKIDNDNSETEKIELEGEKNNPITEVTEPTGKTKENSPETIESKEEKIEPEETAEPNKDKIETALKTDEPQ